MSDELLEAVREYDEMVDRAYRPWRVTGLTEEQLKDLAAISQRIHQLKQKRLGGTAA